jgi:hypothetical protein
MQSKIESNSRFESIIKDDPIELLKIIKQHALKYHEHRYEMAIMLKSLRTLVTLKQKEGESLKDYTKWFKVSRDVLRSHIGGPIILSKYMTTMENYDKKNATKVAECKDQAYQQLLAYIYLDNSDKAKYGTLINELQTQQSLKNNQYPKTGTEANNVLNNHRFDNYNTKRNNDRSSKESSKDTESDSKEKEE